MSEQETISIEEATREVELTARRLGLLHLSFARAIVDELGEEKGKKLILKAIKDYGKRLGTKARQGVIDLGLEPSPRNYYSDKIRDVPKLGESSKYGEVDGERRIYVYGCPIAKVWKEYDEEELGRLYCYVDPAKYMSYNPDFKLIHLQSIPDGHDCCEMVLRRTTENEKEDFQSEDADWSYIDDESIKNRKVD